MEFDTEEQRQTYAQVGEWLSDIVGDNVVKREESPVYVVPVGSALVSVLVFPWPNFSDAVIQAVTFVALGPEMGTDLGTYLLQENETFRFGAFAADSDGDISFRYSVMASAMTKQSLRRAIESVAITADRYGDTIISRWGGKSGIDWVPGAPD